MSTYLLAFVVSDFENELCPPTGNGVQFRIWARKNALDQGGYMLAPSLDQNYRPRSSAIRVQGCVCFVLLSLSIPLQRFNM